MAPLPDSSIEEIPPPPYVIVPSAPLPDPSPKKEAPQSQKHRKKRTIPRPPNQEDQKEQ